MAVHVCRALGDIGNVQAAPVAHKQPADKGKVSRAGSQCTCPVMPACHPILSTLEWTSKSIQSAAVSGLWLVLGPHCCAGLPLLCRPSKASLRLMQPRRSQPRARQPKSQLCHPGVSRARSLELSTRVAQMRLMQQQQPAEAWAPQQQHGRGSHNSNRNNSYRRSKQHRSQHSSSRAQSCHHCLTSTDLTGTTHLQSASMLMTSTPTSAASSPSTAPQQTTWSRRCVCISTTQLLPALRMHA